MRIAILYNNDKIFIEYSQEKFRELLNKYFDQFKNIDLSLDKIIDDIKKETLYK